jgi:hypothetical protein
MHVVRRVQPCPFFCVWLTCKQTSLTHSVLLHHPAAPHRERKKAKAASLQASADELAQRVAEVDALQRANAVLAARNAELEALTAAQAQQVQQRDARLAAQARRLEQQGGEMEALRGQLAGAGSDLNNAGGSDVGGQLATALRAVLADKDVAEVQAALGLLPENVLQRIHDRCREVPARMARKRAAASAHTIQVSCF